MWPAARTRPLCACGVHMEGHAVGAGLVDVGEDAADRAGGEAEQVEVGRIGQEGLGGRDRVEARAVVPNLGQGQAWSDAAWNR